MKSLMVISALLIFLLLEFSVSLQAQDSKFEDLKNATEDLAGLIDADNSKSALCEAYVGKVVVPSAFGSLIQAVPKLTEKGEFETTAQFEARIAAANAQPPSGPFVLSFPVQRSYLRYDADVSSMSVGAGAFDTGRYSDETGADLAGWGAKDKAQAEGTPLFHSRGTEKLVKSYPARSRSGTAFKVSEFERQTNAIYLSSKSLFPFARRAESPVMMFDVPLAQAPFLKDSLKLALVVIPQSPYIYKGDVGPVVPSLGTPNVYKEFITVAFVSAKCALALDGKNRVLASMDAGS